MKMKEQIIKCGGKFVERFKNINQEVHSNSGWTAEIHYSSEGIPLLIVYSINLAFIEKSQEES